jgi:transcriptional regulator with XRE-family HTH domain
MAAPITDLHPDDTAARDLLADTLRSIRRKARITGQDLADRLEVTEAAVSHMQHARNWTVRLVQRWARGLDHRLIVGFDGLTVPDDGDGLAAVYAAMEPEEPAVQDRLYLRAIVNDLARVRRALGITQAALSAQLGLSESAASWWELNPDGTRVASIQRYARALGGSAVFGLAPVEAEAVAG